MKAIVVFGEKPRDFWYSCFELYLGMTKAL
jgi:hypothetical protein